MVLRHTAGSPRDQHGPPPTLDTAGRGARLSLGTGAAGCGPAEVARLPPPELGAGVTHALSHGAEEAAQATVARCSGSARSLFVFVKWLERPRRGGAAASEPSLPAPLARSRPVTSAVLT